MKLEDLAAEHEYYCNTGNFFSNECSFTCETVQEFLDLMGDSDMDMNLLFRWDVKKHEVYDEEDENEDSPKGYYAEMFFMGQRKGVFTSYQIEKITEQDVEAFVAFVEPRYKHLMSLWAPFSK